MSTRPMATRPHARSFLYLVLLGLLAIALAYAMITMLYDHAVANADSGSAGSGSAVVIYDAAPAPDASITAPPAHTTLPSIPDPSDSKLGFVEASYRWVTSGNGWLALCPFLIALVWIARHPKTWPLSKSVKFQAFVKTARGAAVLVIVVSFAGALLHAIVATGGAPSAAGLKAAALAGGTGAGWYSIGKALIFG